MNKLKSNYIILLYLILSCSNYVCSSTMDDDRFFFKRLESLNKNVLCEDNSAYLECMEVSSNECQIDISKVAEICSSLYMNEKPEHDSDLQLFKSFGERYGNCLVDEHIKLRNMDLISTRKCLKTIFE